MTTVAFDHLAKENPDISFVHAHPGFVKTEGQNFPGLFSLLVRTVMWIGGRWILVPEEESGERNLFYATSEIYPASQKAKEAKDSIGGEGKGGEAQPGVPGWRAAGTGEESP